MSIKETRNTYIDTVKAFAIFCVVLGHCIQYAGGDTNLEQGLFFENIFFKLIYSFHMPLFMLISGFLFEYSLKKNTCRNVLKNRIKTLLIPIVAWTILQIGLFVVQSMLAHETLSVLVLFRRLVIILGTLWFLLAVFGCSLVIIIVKHFFGDSKWIYLLGFITTFFLPDNYGLDLCKFMYPYFVVGYFYNKDGISKKECMLKKNYALFLSGVFFAFLLFFYQYNSYIYTSGYMILTETPFKQFKIDIFRFVIGLVGSIFVLLLFKKIYAYFTGTVQKIICFMGKNTMAIYIISGLIISNVLTKMTSCLPGINYFLIIPETIIVIAFSLFFTMAIKCSRVLNQIFLGGRR